MDGDSYVGNVNSNDGQLNLNRSNGNANPNYGVGVSTRQMFYCSHMSRTYLDMFYWTDLRQPPNMRPISVVLACSWCSVVSLASFWVSNILS